MPLFKSRLARKKKEVSETWEKEYILMHLDKWAWNVSYAACDMQINQPNLRRRMRLLGIKRRGTK